MFGFKIIHKDKNSRARVGKITTAHGEIETPVFVPVGTLAAVKGLSPEEISASGGQVVLCNTYHLYLRPGAEEIKEFGGLHKFMNWPGPIITDSGGFQVFSLGLSAKITSADKKLMTKITDEEVIFKSHLDGSVHKFTPEKSLDIQEKLGSDIMMSFDHCPPYPSTYEYTKEAIGRTLKWAKRGLAVWQNKENALYGISQGGIYEDLRKQSAGEIGKLPFPGFAIGGVAVGENKAQMKDAVGWSIPYLPEEKPRHLLGVGEIDDLFIGVEEGIDTFDCVAPTRLGRMGQIYTDNPADWGRKKYQMDIMKSRYAKDPLPPVKNCACYTCRHYSRAYLHHLFRNEELLAYRFASLHNVFFLLNLMKEIRMAVMENRLPSLKQKWIRNHYETA